MRVGGWGDCLVRYRILSNISGLYPLRTRNISQLWQPQMTSNIANVFWGAKSPSVLNESPRKWISGGKTSDRIRTDNLGDIGVENVGRKGEVGKGGCWEKSGVCYFEMKIQGAELYPCRGVWQTVEYTSLKFHEEVCPWRRDLSAVSSSEGGGV